MSTHMSGFGAVCLLPSVITVMEIIGCSHVLLPPNPQPPKRPPPRPSTFDCRTLVHREACEAAGPFCVWIEDQWNPAGGLCYRRAGGYAAAVDVMGTMTDEDYVNQILNNDCCVIHAADCLACIPSDTGFQQGNVWSVR